MPANNFPLAATSHSGSESHDWGSGTRRRLHDPLDQAGSDERVKKRRRRILSCDACRRLKCRCELPEGSDVCARCRTLRIPCLKSESFDHTKVEIECAKPLDFAERLTRLEHSIVEIKNTLQSLQSAQHNSPANKATCNSALRTVEAKTQPSALEDTAEPNDQHVDASPAEVIRKVASQLSQGYRRMFDIQDDLVSLGLFEMSTARDLIASFIHRRRNILLINSESDLSSCGNLRQASPFLFSVCCLHEMRYSRLPTEDPFKHRLVYEHVRQMLGQVMLASPLRLEEITGVLIMALFGASPTRGPEYLDSWLLSGHCAQQAMLRISFSDISKKVGLGTPAESDQRAMRVWANICLVHLHWGATMGRPSTLPASYLGQCRTLLNFDQATLRDAMLFAEISLYSALEKMLSCKELPKNASSWEELGKWRQKWGYLLSLPTSSTLELGYRIARLILIRRSLDRAKQSHEDHSSGCDPKSRTEQLEPGDVSLGEMQAHLCKLALDVISGFIAIPASTCGDLPDFYKICVAYSLFILSQNEPKSVGVPASEIIAHLEEMQRRCAQPWVTCIAMDFSVEKALKRFHRDPQSGTGSAEEPSITDNSVLTPQGTVTSQGAVLSNKNAEEGLEVPISPFGLSRDADFELFGCMEDFFSGGYLGMEPTNGSKNSA